ncbi:hypothetical protein CCAX7_14790 [Capsulimonas corticalis]|uniref:Uncharacterized protein n=1 Tax=Capsulimonas corticalis TaxID=2219043 RepID=A0A402CZF9_9BACT|nr:hypothetical protein [Capsulimonas corticalis]BDI29428.1 hypothetical protein CCAX7_14790 [Capsulimonas corticalis]
MHSLLTAPLAVASPAPDAAWIVGACPACGGPTVENEYRVGGSDYKTIKNCWNAIGECPTCDVFDADAYRPVAKENLAMEPTLTETPTVLTVAAALAVCDRLLAEMENKPDAYRAAAVRWFRGEVIKGAGAFCPKCTFPILGTYCGVCPAIVVARATERDEEWMSEATGGVNTHESRSRMLDIARLELIYELCAFQASIDLAADNIVFAEVGAAADLANAAQLQEAA